MDKIWGNTHAPGEGTFFSIRTKTNGAMIRVRASERGGGGGQKGRERNNFLPVIAAKSAAGTGGGGRVINEERGRVFAN